MKTSQIRRAHTPAPTPAPKAKPVLVEATAPKPEPVQEAPKAENGVEAQMAGIGGALMAGHPLEAALESVGWNITLVPRPASANALRDWKARLEARAANVQASMAEGKPAFEPDSQQMQMYEALKAGISHADIVQRFGIKTGQVGQRVRQTASSSAQT